MHRLQIAPPCPTASKLALAFACPASVLLSRDCSDKPSAAASWGDLVHSMAAAICMGNESYVPFEATEEQLPVLRAISYSLSEQNRIDLENIEPRGVRYVEAGYAYDLRTGEVRGPFSREPGQTGRPWEVCGSADLVFRRDDGRLVVRDWKADDGKTARVADPSTHHQLWFLALCASRVHGIGAGVVVQLAFYSERGIWIDEHEVTQADLVQFESSLLELAAALEAYPQPKPGWHCEGLYCPAHASTCNAARALAERTVDAVQPLPAELLRRAARSPEEARLQYEALRVLRKVEPLLEAHVKAYAHAKGPIPIAHGIELRAKVAKGRDEVLDTPEALEGVRRSLCEARKDAGRAVEYDDFTTRSTSKPLILSAWSDLTGKKKGSADARKFIVTLREKGLIVDGAPHIRLDEYAAGAADDEPTEASEP